MRAKEKECVHTVYCLIDRENPLFAAHHCSHYLCYLVFIHIYMLIVLTLAVLHFSKIYSQKILPGEKKYIIGNTEEMCLF